MKKLLALLLAIVMIFSLCACGKDDDGGKDPEPTKGSEDPEPNKGGSVEDLDIVGDWVATIDMGEAIELAANILPEAEEIPEELLEMMGDLYDGTEFSLDVSFSKKGTASLGLDPADIIEALIDGLLEDEDALYDFMLARTEYQMEALGMDEDDFEDEIGMSIEEFVEAEINALEDLDFAELRKNFEMDVLEGSVDYELDGDELTLVDEEGEGAKLTINYNGKKITVEKVKFLGEVSGNVPEDAMAAAIKMMVFTKK